MRHRHRWNFTFGGFKEKKISLKCTGNDRKKGLKIGETYTNDYQAKEFIHYIAEDERRKIRVRLSDGKFISVMSDGCLESAVRGRSKLVLSG